MIILLFGVSNVGKTTTGKIIAEKTGYQFYDLDEETRKYYHTTTEGFMKRHPDLQDRDHRRAKLLKRLLKNKKNVVVAITPTSFIDDYIECIFAADTMPVELTDSVENIFNRVIFTDENDQLMPDYIEYRNKHRDHYMREIAEDLLYYHHIYQIFDNEWSINGKSPIEIADEIIEYYQL